MHNFKFELITGPMSCGKTEELLRRLRRATIANKKVKVFSPTIDTRVFSNYIQSRVGTKNEAIKVHSAFDILNYIEEDDEIIAIDELQFFDDKIVSVIRRLMADGKKVIGSGLELDFKEEPFGAMPQLLCYADKVDKLTAICKKCGSEYAVRTQRLIDGKPAEAFSPLIMIGGDESYEARCQDCYEINNEYHIRKLKNKRKQEFVMN
ncbi:MAG: thymidine kinase [Candidatus Gastranaerophilales bacterium]|nr:thymidine kinase [Candidatus Gastranaerophilales bacterium]